MHFSWLRPLWLLALTAFLALQSGAAGAQAFDRQAENQRYRQWLGDFKQDLERLRQSSDPGNADVDSLFAKTLMPGSRATQLARELARVPGGATSGEIHFVGIQRIFLAVLSDSVVAGDGGIYPETQAAYRKNALRVRYMHVDGGGRLEPYFNDSGAFKPYRLPETGTLERDAYPFLLFEDRDGMLRLGGVSKEFWELVRFVDALQHA